MIYNPKSGKQTFTTHLDMINKRLKKEGYIGHAIETKYHKHAIKIAQDIEKTPVDLLIIAGGDGTFNECLNGLMKHGKIPTLGYLPVGTSCDIAHTLGIPRNIHKALDLVFKGKHVMMDIIKSNHGYFTYVAATGSYVDISYQTPKKMKKRLGYIAYLLSGIKAFFTVPKMALTIDTPTYKKKDTYTLILLTNSQKIARLTLVDRPVLDDGKIDLITFAYIPLLNNFMYAVKFLLNPKSLIGLKRIQASSGVIDMQEPYPWSQDGEAQGKGKLTFEVIQKKLPIVINPKRQRYFLNQDKQEINE